MKESEGICRLVAYNGSLQIAHWLADTVTNEHKALGDLYEKMVGLVDDFAEVYMGKNGLIAFPKDAAITDITKSPAVAGLELVEELQEQFEAGEDDDLLNILADMQSALNKARYLLKEQPEMPKKKEKEEVKPKVVEAISRQFRSK